MSDSHRPSVLVVDDSRVIRESLRRYLGDAFEVETADDGEQGWAHLLERGPFDLLITDIAMPNLDGYGLICRVRDAGDTAFSSLPIVVITALEDDVVRIRAFACGADDFIPKPLDRRTLVGQLQARLTGDARQPSRAAAAHEPLATLLSAQALASAADRLLADARRDDRPIAVLTVELPGLDEVQARFGKQTRRQVQGWLADILQRDRRAGDLVGAMQDPERICVVLDHTHHHGAIVTAERLYSVIAADPYPESEIAALLTPVVGYALRGEEDAETFGQLLALADQRRESREQVVAMRVDESVIERPDLEQALQLLETGEEGKLLPYAVDIAARLLPLLAACSQQLALDVETELETIEQRLKALM